MKRTTMRHEDLIKIGALFFISIVSFYMGKNWTSNGSQHFIFFNSRQHFPSSYLTVSLSPYFNKTFDISSLINDTTVASPPPPPVVNENVDQRNDFEAETYDPNTVQGNETEEKEKVPESDKGGDNVVEIKKFAECPIDKRDYIPCLDNVDAIQKLDSTDKGEKFERHCPEKGQGLNCLITPPNGYRRRISWPKSRDEVWFSNVPHARLVEDKGGQNWITIDKDKFKFPGGGTQFIHGANEYLDQIEKMVPEITFGRHTRVVLDVGCGVASFGAYLFSRNALTLSVAPKDVHENQIQFALERGVPAMAAAFATRRLLYPSQAFDLIHCSRCRINWTRDDGILLLEVNRLLRAGGYFTWAAQPVYKHEPALEKQWQEMVSVTDSMCWNLVKKDGYIAIWQKPLNNDCYINRDEGIKPPLCDPNDDPDNVWYVNLKACITRLPEDGLGANVTVWPQRLKSPSGRLGSKQYVKYTTREEPFGTSEKFWNKFIGFRVRNDKWKKLELRNVLDMKAGFGGFAAALIEHKFDCWVLNVVPVSGPNTLPIIYDRGLIGVMHDWCESLDTYPRTYDLLHAAYLFSVEQKRCKISSIMLEMDRILRPGGEVWIRDTVSVINEVQVIAKGMSWDTNVRLTIAGKQRVLKCVKP